MISVLTTDNYSAKALGLLAAQKDICLSAAQKKQPDAAELQNIDALLIRSQTTVDEKLLKLAPHLKLIISTTSGTDHIDFEACKQQQVTVVNTSSANTQAAAEHTMLLMLNLLRKVRDAHASVVEGTWKKPLSRGSQLNNKTLGIIGLGKVGTKVSQMAKAFGMQVMAHDPFIDTEHFHAHGVKPMGLSELLRLCDIVSLHVPLTSKTLRMLNKNNLIMMPEESYIVNTSRGLVIDESDLTDFLQNGQLAGAALDVYRKEPLPRDSRLREFKHVYLTPHIGAFTHEAFEKGSMEAVELLFKHFGLS